MSKLPRSLRYGLFLALTLLPIIASAYSFSSLASADKRTARRVQRIERLALPLGLPTTDAFTQRKIDDYLEQGGRSTERMLGRANRYFPVFEYYLHKHGMPADLKYLAVAESMLVPNVVSSASAAGLWQLMPATAREMGLSVNGEIDERLDLHRSTEAAVLMLKGLHAEFGDWNLALAAYNCGKGRVRSAVRRAGARDYERVNNYLPRETRRYVAAYLAAAYAVNYYGDHGLSPRELPEVSTIRVYKHTSLNKIARACDVRLSTLIRMNPVFVQRYIPGSEEGYRLRVPQEDKRAVQQFLWGRPNLVELPVDVNLETAYAIADQQQFDPYRMLLGCTAGAVVYDQPAGYFNVLRERLVLNVFSAYRSLASL